MYRFLMIEDDIQICEVVQDFFARESKGTIQVETAQDGELGLEKFYENEFDLVLLENKGTLLLRERLLIGIWGYDYEGTDRCVDNHVRKLRKHLGNAGRCIKTVVGKGYKIEETLPKKGA